MQEKAKAILEYFNNFRHSFNSSIFKSDITKETKETRILFWTQKHTTTNLSDRLSKQIINYHAVFEYRKSLESYLERNSSKTEGFLIFETERKVDEEGFNNAKLLYSLCNNILKVYQKMLDTQKFDEQVGNAVTFLKDNIKRKPWGDYGVIFVYAIEVMPQINNKDKEWLLNFKNASDKLLTMSQTDDKEPEFKK